MQWSKGIIRSRRSKKNRQHNGQKKEDKRTNDSLQYTTQKTKDWPTWTSLTTGVNSWVSSSCSTCGTRRVTLVTNLVISHEWEQMWLWQTEHFRGHLWHRYSVTVNQVMVATINLHFRSDHLNFTIMNLWFSSFIVSSNPISIISW